MGRAPVPLDQRKPKVPKPKVYGTEKPCTYCKKVKPLCEFYERKRKGRVGYFSRCKPCTKNIFVEWRDNNTERFLANRKVSVKKWKARNPLLNKIKDNLSKTRTLARVEGYEPCNAKAEYVFALFRTVCDCCGKDVGQSICLDHCHKTGKFRGFLCRNCNFALGQVGENIDTLRKLIAYLEGNRNANPT